MMVQAARIAQRRKMLRLTQEELGLLVGTSQKQISKYEKGLNDPTGEVITALAQALNTTTDYLLGLTDLPDRPMRNESDLSPDEIELLNLYRKKSLDQRRKVMEIAKVV